MDTGILAYGIEQLVERRPAGTSARSAQRRRRQTAKLQNKRKIFIHVKSIFIDVLRVAASARYAVVKPIRP